MTDGLVRQWEGRMINIHPSLLPLFEGLHTHARALEAGVRLAGCTVHYVTPELDSGPIIAQAAVPVLPDDSPESLAARIRRPSTASIRQRSAWSPAVPPAWSMAGLRSTQAPIRKAELYFALDIS